MALKNMEHAAAKTAALEWLERFKLADRAKSKIEELSKGNQQKVQFILSVLHNPDVLVLDEPFAGFDPIDRDLLTEIILEQKSKGKAIIFSTHQMEQAEKLCDSICLINRGGVVLSGTIAEVKSRFSKNSLHIEFSGDSGVLAGVPGVTNTSIYGSVAELGCRATQVLTPRSDTCWIKFRSAKSNSSSRRCTRFLSRNGGGGETMLNIHSNSEEPHE